MCDELYSNFFVLFFVIQDVLLYTNDPTNFRPFTEQSGQSQLHSVQNVHQFKWSMKLLSYKSNTPTRAYVLHMVCLDTHLS